MWAVTEVIAITERVADALFFSPVAEFLILLARNFSCV